MNLVYSWRLKPLHVIKLTSLEGQLSFLSCSCIPSTNLSLQIVCHQAPWQTIQMQRWIRHDPWLQRPVMWRGTQTPCQTGVHGTCQSGQGTKDAAGWEGVVIPLSDTTVSWVGLGFLGEEQEEEKALQGQSGWWDMWEKEGSPCAAAAENCGQRPGHPTSSPALSPGSISGENLKVQTQMLASGGLLN